MKKIDREGRYKEEDSIVKKIDRDRSVKEEESRVKNIEEREIKIGRK